MIVNSSDLSLVVDVPAIVLGIHVLVDGAHCCLAGLGLLVPTVAIAVSCLLMCVLSWHWMRRLLRGIVDGSMRQYLPQQ